MGRTMMPETNDTTAPAGDGSASTAPARTRRPNGDGLLRQRTDGRWETAYIDIDGRRKWLTGRTGETPKQLAARLRQRVAGRDQGLPAPTSGRTTVADFLDRWLADVVRPNRAHNTVLNYGNIIEKYIKPALGRVKLAELTPDHVRRLMGTAATAGHVATAGRIRVVLRAALNQAVADGLLGRNVAAGRGGVPPKPATEKEPREPMTLERARAILAAVRGDRLEALYGTLLATGCRISELLGLTWADVDADAATISIRRQLQRVGADYRLVDLKTAGSRRTLPIPRATVDTLRAHRARQAEEHLRAGPLWQPLDLVFCREDGGPLHRSTALHRFQQLARRAGLGAVDLHGLRHGLATILIDRGENPKTVQELLGHTSLKMTLGLYARAVDHSKRAAVGWLDEAAAN